MCLSCTEARDQDNSYLARSCSRRSACLWKVKTMGSDRLCRLQRRRLGGRLRSAATQIEAPFTGGRPTGCRSTRWPAIMASRHSICAHSSIRKVTFTDFVRFERLKRTHAMLSDPRQARSLSTGDMARRALSQVAFSPSSPPKPELTSTIIQIANGCLGACCGNSGQKGMGHGQG